MEKLLELVEGWNCFFSRSTLELAVKLGRLCQCGSGRMGSSTTGAALDGDLVEVELSAWALTAILCHRLLYELYV